MRGAVIGVLKVGAHPEPDPVVQVLVCAAGSNLAADAFGAGIARGTVRRDRLADLGQIAPELGRVDDRQRPRGGGRFIPSADHGRIGGPQQSAQILVSML